VWKDHKARKEHCCLCCGSKIQNGEPYSTEYKFESGMFPDALDYCSLCAPWLKRGYSYNEARRRGIYGYVEIGHLFKEEEASP
jgi:hypothetical protein